MGPDEGKELVLMKRIVSLLRMRRAILLATSMALAVLLACGVALAATVGCTGGDCVGTRSGEGAELRTSRCVP